MAQLQTWFRQVDRSGRGEITPTDLAALPFANQPLGIKNATKILRVFDKDNSGTINFNEYASLHGFLTKMTSAFYTNDTQRQGILNANDVQRALAAAGFELTAQTVQAVVTKYSGAAPGQPAGVRIDGFLSVCAHFAAVRSVFEWNDTQRTGKVTFSYDALCHVSLFLSD
jgi:Ca2+-binding EF-hand superfamily protein